MGELFYGLIKKAMTTTSSTTSAEVKAILDMVEAAEENCEEAQLTGSFNSLLPFIVLVVSCSSYMGHFPKCCQISHFRIFVKNVRYLA